MDSMMATLLRFGEAVEAGTNLPASFAVGIAIASLVIGMIIPLALLWLPSSVEVGNISRIFVHPVKGCRGIEVKEWVVGKTGLKWDRAWMIIQDEEEEFLSQRKASVLAGINAEVTTFAGPAAGDNPWDGDSIALSAPKCGSIVVPITTMDGCATGAVAPEGAGAIRTVALFNRHVRGIDQGDAAAAWLTKTVAKLGGDLVAEGSKAKPSEIAGKKLRLLYMLSEDGAGEDPTLDPTAAMAGSGTRSISASHAHSGFRSSLAFSDAMPVLVASESNAVDLTRRMKAERKAAKGGPLTPTQVAEEPLDIRRFRPNIVLNHGMPWAEDHWLQISFEGTDGQRVHMRRTKRCARCSVPTVDPVTWRRAGIGAEPSSTMRSFRRHPEKKSLVCFGSYFVVADASEGAVLRQGDSVTVHEMDTRHT